MLIYLNDSTVKQLQGYDSEWKGSVGFKFKELEKFHSACKAGSTLVFCYNK